MRGSRWKGWKLCPGEALRTFRLCTPASPAGEISLTTPRVDDRQLDGAVVHVRKAVVPHRTAVAHACFHCAGPGGQDAQRASADSWEISGKSGTVPNDRAGSGLVERIGCFCRGGACPGASGQSPRCVARGSGCCFDRWAAEEGGIDVGLRQTLDGKRLLSAGLHRRSRSQQEVRILLVIGKDEGGYHKRCIFCGCVKSSAGAACCRTTGITRCVSRTFYIDDLLRPQEGLDQKWGCTGVMQPKKYLGGLILMREKPWARVCSTGFNLDECIF